MRKDIYLDIKATMDPIDLVEPLKLDPIQLTNHSKFFFEKKYPATAKEIKKAITHNTAVVHIKNTQKKSYDVLTPYLGEVQTEGVGELIYQMYGTMGVIDTFPILYKDETSHIMRAVAPRYNSHTEYSSQSPYNNLDWHVDAAYRPMVPEGDLSPMPDYLIFGIVHKGYENLPIIYVALQDIISQLSKEEIEAGLSGEFAVASPDSFANKIVKTNIPLLVKNNDGSFCSRITLQNTTPLTERAADFLRRIRTITNQKDIQNTVEVEPGDIVVLNNKTTLHKRDSFQPKEDGKDRYFIRIYSVKEINHGILSDVNNKYMWT